MSTTPELKIGTIVKIFPTAIWIEDGMFGERAVMLQHEGCEPHAWCIFYYDWRYTSNASTWAAAEAMALSLGATAPIEHRNRGFPPFRWWHHAISWFYTARQKARAMLSARPTGDKT